MNHALVGKWAVRYECQRSSITASVCGLLMLIAALAILLAEFLGGAVAARWIGNRI